MRWVGNTRRLGASAGISTGIVLAVLACAHQAHAATAVALDTRGLSRDDIIASRGLLADAAARLPPGFMESSGSALTLRWRDDLPGAVHGRTRGGDIGLRRALLEERVRRRSAHAADAALVALVHELAHAYDRSPRGGISGEPRLLDLAGWPVKPLRLGLRSAHSDFRDRTPDPYELVSPAEFFAVNFEYFVLDPDYACRRPALHRLFAQRFGWSPPASACAPGQVLVGAGQGGEALRMLQVDPDRIYQVDYLFAEANARPMSRWGHSMLRLVVCAPGRAPGPECRLDLEHHLVLSFRAYVDDLQISSWRGLTGSYPSRLFVLPLDQVIDEYTKVELRGLRSVPLRLEHDEIGKLVERAARVHWSYDGRYYFVSNNCAVETWKLLHDGVPRLARLPLRSITPDGLLRRLQRAGIADASPLADPGEALRLGYRFESQAAYFGQMFAVADAELALPQDDAIDWMDADPAHRQPFLERGGMRASAALLLLEQAALRREQAGAREWLKQRFLRNGGARGEDASAAVATLRELLDDGAQLSRPAALLGDEGYGLPQAGERIALAQAVAARSRQVETLQARLETDTRVLLPAQTVRRIDAVEANLMLLGRRLRQLTGNQR